MSNITSTSTINFFSDTVIAVKTDEVVYVPIKPICENLGIAWSGQLVKINNDPTLSKAITEIVIPSNGGPQTVICLQLKYMYGWLMKLNPSKVAPHVSDKLIQYQELIYDVIYDHFHPKSNSTEISTQDAIFSKLTDIVSYHDKELISLEKDVAGAFKIQQEQIYELNTRLSIEIAVLKNTIEIHNDQYRLGAYAQANQIKQAASKTIASVRYIPIKAAKTDENLKPRIEEYSRIFGYYTLSNKLLKWAFDRGSEIKKLGNLNTYPYQLLLDFFDPRYNKELSKFIDFSKFKEYKKG